jgi:hypothetical protein
VADAHCPALPPGFKLKTPPFPSKYAEPMTLDANKLKKALKKHLDFARVRVRTSMPTRTGRPSSSAPA